MGNINVEQYKTRRKEFYNISKHKIVNLLLAMICPSNGALKDTQSNEQPYNVCIVYIPDIPVLIQYGDKIYNLLG